MNKNESKYTIYNNELYVQTSICGIEPLIVLSDGLMQTGFTDSKCSWIKVSIAIAWFENEIIEGLGRNYPAEELDYYQQCILMHEERVRQHIIEGKTDFEPIITWKGKRGY